MVRRETQEPPQIPGWLNLLEQPRQETEGLEQGQPQPVDLQVEPNEIIQEIAAPFLLTPAQANVGDVLDYAAPAGVKICE